MNKIGIIKALLDCCDRHIVVVKDVGNYIDCHHIKVQQRTYTGDEVCRDAGFKVNLVEMFPVKIKYANSVVTVANVGECTCEKVYVEVPND